MKFGVSPLSYQFIEKNYVEKKGMDSVNTLKITHFVEQSVKMGFKHFEIRLDIFQDFPIFFGWEELKKLKEDFDISYSCLFPVFSIDLAGINIFIRKASVKSYISAYNTIKELTEHIDYFIINPIGEESSKILKYLGKSLEMQESTLINRKCNKNIRIYSKCLYKHS